MSSIDLPVPLSDIESVLAWVDTYKLSRPTKKINRDFSDAVLLAEMLSVHYPKLVEMHNYPPRNSHALKLNNWMTLNRKVLKKLKLNLCCNTMERLANCEAGVVERVLLMVRDKIRHDEELNKSTKESEQNMSSGGSYYEACGDDDHVLVVPVKTRVNGILETVQQKVVNYESFQTLKQELKDAKDSIEILKQKVEHLDNMLKLKDERIEELQKQLDRKQARRKEAEFLQNSLSVPFETLQTPVITDILPMNRKSSVQSVESNGKATKEESKIPVAKEESKIPIPINDFANMRTNAKPSITDVLSADSTNKHLSNIDLIGHEVDKIKSDVFKDAPCMDNYAIDYVKELDLKKSNLASKEILNNVTNINSKTVPIKDIINLDEFMDSSPNSIVTIEDTIKKEINDIIAPKYGNPDVLYNKIDIS